MLRHDSTSDVFRSFTTHNGLDIELVTRGNKVEIHTAATGCEWIRSFRCYAGTLNVDAAVSRGSLPSNIDALVAAHSASALAFKAARRAEVSRALADTLNEALDG